MLNKYPFLSVYNPWWDNPGHTFDLPSFHRDVFDDLYADVVQLPQMISVTGPRRVGKSTLLQQCIQQLLQDHGAEQAQRIVYFTMDDPALGLPHIDAHQFFDDLVREFASRAGNGPVYLFLDEIQRFPRWELYLKKYYDLKTPVRFVVSGSASAPIFKKSHESLLGRIKSYHVLPFSFREFLFFRHGEKIKGFSTSESLRKIGNTLRKLHSSQNLFEFLDGVIWSGLTRPTAKSDVSDVINEYFYEGGFPEVWNLPSLLAKQEYLYQNQVERVIFEDLLVAAEFRKPEMLRRFYLGLLVEPGLETNLAKLSKEIGLARGTIESYFPLLEATDLVWRLHKYTGGKASPKAGNFKTYLIDMAVRSAVMKLTPEQLLADQTMLGYYAENIIANHLRRWPGLVEVAYFRERNKELDFVMDLGAERIAVEVKYRNKLGEDDLLQASELARKLKCSALVVVCKEQLPPPSVTKRLKDKAKIKVSMVPLIDFIMLF